MLRCVLLFLPTSTMIDLSKLFCKKKTRINRHAMAPAVWFSVAVYICMFIPRFLLYFVSSNKKLFQFSFSLCPFSFHKYLKNFPPRTTPSHEWWFEFFHYIFFVLFCSSAQIHTAAKLPKSVWLSLWGKLLNDIGVFHFSFHATLC